MACQSCSPTELQIYSPNTESRRQEPLHRISTLQYYKMLPSSHKNKPGLELHSNSAHEHTCGERGQHVFELPVQRLREHIKQETRGWAQGVNASRPDSVPQQRAVCAIKKTVSVLLSASEQPQLKDEDLYPDPLHRCEMDMEIHPPGSILQWGPAHDQQPKLVQNHFLL